MPLPASLALIPDDAVDLTFPAPQYSSDLASIVGNAGDDSDGFETIFSALADHAAQGPGVLTGIDGILAEVGGIGDPAALPFEGEFSDALTTTIQQGQPDFDALATHLTGSNPPASGGGGTPSGGGASQCATIDFGAIPVTGPLGSTTVKQTLYLQNTGSTPLHIISTKWNPDEGFTFVLDPALTGAVVQPGQQVAVTIDFTPGSVGSYQSTLTINTDRADPQPCLMAKGTGTTGTPTGGGQPKCPTGNLVKQGGLTLKAQCA
jgi:hypothetical protein